jgi:hypothetical protein
VGVVGRLWFQRTLHTGFSEIVNMEGGGVGCENERLRRKRVNQRWRIDAIVGAMRISALLFL